ncbi:MAG: thymidine phosphorylase [Alphaproteobacteria bacterium]
MTNEQNFLPQEVIRIKRDGGTLTRGDIAAFVKGLTHGSVTDAQGAAFAMAVFFRGMTAAEGAALTLAMRDSGRVLDWRELGIDRPVVDKHSTGGVGDKVSLILAPLAAACGGAVPMISGRGLGHTGGTLDKLAAIPGYDTAPDLGRFIRIVKEAGCSIIGQTDDLAPADRRLYAIRDVTATVESIPLITASILSKKLAAGLDALVMDVKFGNGAFMDSPEAARELGHSIVSVAEEAGLPVTALLTDMNQVLGRTAGNALEVAEAVSVLTNPAGADARLREVTLELASRMAVRAGLQDTLGAARRTVEDALHSGRAAEAFARMAAAHGGPADLLERPADHLPAAPVVKPVTADSAGYVETMQTREIGMAIVALGGGRTRPDQPIDPAVGFSDVCRIGDLIETGAPLATVHARTEQDAEAAAARFRAAITLTQRKPRPEPVVLEAVV